MEYVEQIIRAYDTITNLKWSLPAITGGVAIIAFGLLIIFFKKKAEVLAELSAEKSLEKFKNKLSTGKDYLFRDEAIRINLLSYVGEKSIDKKIECWALCYADYFNYQKSWSLDVQNNKGEFILIDNKLAETREKLFIDTIYLGWDLSQNMIHLNSLMRTQLRNKIHSNGNDCEEEITNILHETEKLLINTLHSSDNIEKYDFNDQQKIQLNELSQKQFENINSIC